MTIQQLQDEVDYPNTEDGITDAVEAALDDDPVGIHDGNHHVVYTPYGKLTVCRKAGSTEAPEHLFTAFELGTDMVDKEIEDVQAVQVVTEKIEEDVLSYGDIQAVLTHTGDNRAILRVEA